MDTNDRLLTIREVGEYLGVPVATLYQWRHRSKRPPGLKVGRHVRYRRSDLDAWIDRHFEAATDTSRTVAKN